MPPFDMSGVNTVHSTDNSAPLRVSVSRPLHAEIVQAEPIHPYLSASYVRISSY